MLFIAGFRDTSVGTDTQNYYEIYEYFRLETYPPWFTIEPGWRIINNLAVKIHAGYSLVVFLASLFTLVPIFLTIWKYSDRPFVSVLFFYLLFFYFQSFNVARQMIAIAIMFSAYNDYLHGKKKAFISNYLSQYYFTIRQYLEWQFLLFSSIFGLMWQRRLLYCLSHTFWELY